jgi:hypothetical protein
MSETVDEILHLAIVEVGKKGVMMWLTSQSKFFAAPFINPIVGFIVGKILEVAFKYTSLGVYILKVNNRVDKEAVEFKSAAIQNSQILKTGTPDEKAKARAELVAKFDTFVRMSP